MKRKLWNSFVGVLTPLLLSIPYAGASGSSFVERQYQNKNKSSKQLNLESQQRQQRSLEGLAQRKTFLRHLAVAALTRSHTQIAQHVLRLHVGNITPDSHEYVFSKITTSSFDDRNFYTLFNPAIQSVDDFIVMVTHLIDEEQNITFSEGGNNKTIKVIINSSNELGRYFTQDDYNTAQSMRNDQHPTNPMQAGRAGKKLALIIRCDYEHDLPQRIRDMTNEVNFPENVDGFYPDLVTAFLTSN